MDIADLQFHVDAWHEDFMLRFPGRITVAGELRVRLLQLLHQVDAARRQWFTRGPSGEPAFHLAEVAQALGMSLQGALHEALTSSLVIPHLMWIPFVPGAPAEAALSTGGVVLLVAVISPDRFLSPDLRARHRQRRRATMAILRLLPSDDPDAGAQVNRLIEPIKAPVPLVH